MNIASINPQELPSLPLVERSHLVERSNLPKYFEWKDQQAQQQTASAPNKGKEDK